MAYPMYNNNNQFYMQDLQAMKDRIDNQMRQLQQNQQQQQQIPQPITQNFQLAPNPTNNELESKYANNIDEVKNTFVMKTGLFVNKEMDTLWEKNVNGHIRTFKLNEIIEQDPKDIEIQNLKTELENMKLLFNNRVKEEKENITKVSSKTTKK